MYMEKPGSKALLIEEVIANETPSWQEHLREMLYQIFETAERQGLFRTRGEAVKKDENT